jgi:hypothetical protein
MCFCWTPICFNVEHLKYPLKPPFLFCPFQKRSSYFYFYVTKCMLQFFSLCPLNFTERERIGTCRWPMPFNAKCVCEREREYVNVCVSACVSACFPVSNGRKMRVKESRRPVQLMGEAGVRSYFSSTHTLSLSLFLFPTHAHSFSNTHFSRMSTLYLFLSISISLFFSLSLSLYFSLFLFEAEIRVGVFKRMAYARRKI